MMKNAMITIKLKLVALVFALFVSSLNISFSQNTIELSGTCVSGTVVLSEAEVNDEKMSYTGVGTIFGYDNTQFAIWWDTSETKWLLGLDGQPYWYSPDDTTKPNSTLLSGNWTQADFSEGTCDVVIQGSGTNMPIATEIGKSEIQEIQIYSHKGVISVSLGQEEKATVRVYDISGHQVREFVSYKKNIEIDNLHKGSYILSVSIANSTRSEKVFVR